MSALLVDLGGTHLRLGMSLEATPPQVVRRKRIRNFEDGIADSEIWREIVSGITDFAAEVRQILPPASPVVISFPGPVRNGSRIVDAPTVAGAAYEFPDVQSLIRERTGRDVHILNDISAAAWHVVRRIRAKRFMVVTVSSGIGSKIFDHHNSRGVIDDVAYAGEIGHTKA